MYLLLTVIILITLLYVISIGFLQYRRKISTLEAKKVVNRFLNDIFVKEYVEEPNYNIYIGIDESGYPLSNELDKVFSELSKIFPSYYFDQCKIGQNRICYSFVISDPLLEMTEKDLYHYLLRTVDSIVHRYIHRVNPLFGHMDNLCAIKLSNNRLFLFIAENNEGRKENAFLINKMNRLLNNVQIQTSPIEEEWGD